MVWKSSRRVSLCFAALTVFKMWVVSGPFDDTESSEQRPLFVFQPLRRLSRDKGTQVRPASARFSHGRRKTLHKQQENLKGPGTVYRWSPLRRRRSMSPHRVRRATLSLERGSSTPRRSPRSSFTTAARGSSNVERTRVLLRRDRLLPSGAAMRLGLRRRFICGLSFRSESHICGVNRDTE
jgi:hypothetical protein